MNDSPPKNRNSKPLLGRKEKRNHCILDRRSGFDRRRAYSLVYFAGGGLERRRSMERRQHSDRRRLWEMRGIPCALYVD